MTEYEMQFSDIVKYLKNKSKTILTFTSVIVAITIVYSLIMPQTFSSSGQLMPPRKEGGSGGLSAFLQTVSGGGLGLTGMGKNTESQLYNGILTSRSVDEYIIKKLNLSKDDLFKGMTTNEITEFLRDNIAVTVQKNNIIAIDFDLKTGHFSSTEEKKHTAEMSANIINAAIEGLDSVLRYQSTSNANRSKEYVEEELINYYSQLDTVEKELQKYQSNNNILEIDEQFRAMVEQTLIAGTELSIAEAELNIARKEFSDNSPQLKAIKEKYKTLTGQYNNIQTGGLKGNDAYAIPFRKMPELARQYASLYRKRKILEEVILYLETQKHQEAITSARDIPTVDILDLAITPEKRSAPSRKMMLIISFFFGIMISSIYVLYDGYKKNLLVNQS